MRIAIANPQPQAVETLRRALLLEPRHSLAWIARDGAEAVELCAAKPPELLLMELALPRIDGVEATRRIMTATPCPILVVTSSVGASTAGSERSSGASIFTLANPRASASNLIRLSNTVLPTPRRPYRMLLRAALPDRIRSSAMAARSISSSRPASSGGGVPAPGA